MQKRGQLGIIEFKYFMSGFFVGLIGGFLLTFLGAKKILPFQIPFVCGFTKKGQLGMLEAKYFFAGLFVGLIISLVLVALGSHGVLPFKIPLVCG